MATSASVWDMCYRVPVFPFWFHYCVLCHTAGSWAITAHTAVCKLNLIFWWQILFLTVWSQDLISFYYTQQLFQHQKSRYTNGKPFFCTSPMILWTGYPIWRTVEVLSDNKRQDIILFYSVLCCCAIMLLLVAEPACCLLCRGASLHVAFPPAVGVLMLLVDLFFLLVHCSLCLWKVMQRNVLG